MNEQSKSKEEKPTTADPNYGSVGAQFPQAGRLILFAVLAILIVVGGYFLSRM